MDRSFRSDCTVLYSDGECVIEILQSAVACMALEFTMLATAEITTLTLVFQNKTSLKLVLDTNMKPGDRALILGKDKALSVRLSRTHLEYLSGFLLQTYRDEMAPVNHVHIEGLRDNADYDLTLLFEVSAKPLTAEQAAKVMGD